MVSLYGRWRRVKGQAVKFHDELEVRPDAVDFKTFDHRVDIGEWQALLFTKGQEPALEFRPGELIPGIAA